MRRVIGVVFFVLMLGLEFYVLSLPQVEDWTDTGVGCVDDCLELAVK